MKTKTWLPLLLFLSSLAGLQAKLPDHARFLPPDMMGMVTLHPGQILNKMDHPSLIHKPMVATLYSSGGPNEWIYELDEDDKKHALITGLFEKPAKTTGIDLSQPVYLVVNNMSKLRVQLFARLTDAKQFEKFALGMIEQKKKWKQTKGGRRALVENSKSLLVHDGGNLILTVTLASNQPNLFQVADQWFEPKESEKLPDFLVQQLEASPDLGIYYPLAPVLPNLAQSLKVGQQPPEYLKQTQLFLHANSAKGKLEATVHVHTGKQQDLQLQSKPLGKEILGFLEKESLLHATASLNLEAVMNHLQYLLPFLGMEMEALGDEILEEFNIDYQELPELFSGEAVFNVTGLELQDEEITFLAALGTKIPAAEVYVKIIHKGLFEAFKGEAPRRNPLERLSITAHGNTLLISSKAHSDVLVQGKANNPLDAPLQNALKKGLFTLLLHFPKVLEELRDAQEEVDRDEELEFVVNRILPHLKDIRIQAQQSENTRYQATLGLHFQNSEDQGLKTFTHLLADLFNPHLRNPTTRPKLLAAEARLQEAPDAFRKAIAGTWNGNFAEEEDQTYYKVTVAKDGTQHYEEIYISREGYSRFSDSGT